MNSHHWYKNAIFYEVNVRAFADGNGDGHGDLRGLTAKLDYFKDLGVDCLWLQPLYPSPLRDDGYDIADYCNVAPKFGTLQDFKILIQKAHMRGMRVITDMVLNHTSDQHPWFQASRLSPNSPYRDYYVWSDTDQKYPEARIIFLDVEQSNWSWDKVAGQYYWHRFYASQPDLNYDNPAVQEEMLKVMQFWLDLGIDGFRTDAVPYLFEREGTNCENLPETHAYLRRVRRFLDEHYPGKILLAEANQWPQDVRAYFGAGDEFHMAFHFPLMPRIFMALSKEDATPIIDILNATPPIPENCQWCTFLRNHDELTLEMVTEQERQYMWETYAPDPRQRLNLGIRRRLAPLLDNDQRKIELLNSILFSLPGSPILYYGDEIGMGDNVWLDDRDGVRTPMQWDDSPNAGFSPPSLSKQSLYAPLIEDEQYGYQRVNVEAQRINPTSLWQTLRRMIATRRLHPALCSGDYRFLPSGDQAVLAILRSSAEETALALHNLSAQAHTVRLDLRDYPHAYAESLLFMRPLPDFQEGFATLTLLPHEYVWLHLM